MREYLQQFAIDRAHICLTDRDRHFDMLLLGPYTGNDPRKRSKRLYRALRINAKRLR